MSDLISRSALLAVPNVCKVTEFDEAGFGMSYLAVPLAAINNAPAVDAEAVRHGRWIEEEPAVYKCSECGFTFTTGDPIEKFVYCRCGAKMDAEVEG